MEAGGAIITGHEVNESQACDDVTRQVDISGSLPGVGSGLVWGVCGRVGIWTSSEEGEKHHASLVSIRPLV